MGNGQVFRFSQEGRVGRPQSCALLRARGALKDDDNDDDTWPHDSMLRTARFYLTT